MRKVLLTGIAAVVGVLAAAFLIYRLLGTGGASPLALLLLAALVSISFPILRANLFPGARECAVEYDFHEKRLEELNRRRITEAWGPDALEQVYTPAGEFADSADRCLLAMLEAPETGKDAELRLALLLTLSRVYEKKGDMRAGIAQLARALNSHPHHFMANFRLALLYEHTGKAGHALVHYRRALLDPRKISRGMQRFTTAQIKRLQAA